MIKECEVKYCISHEIPGLAIELALVKNDSDVYGILDRFTAYTKMLIRDNRLSEVQACFNTAYTLLHQGNRLIQLAVENSFIHSVSCLLEISLNASQPVRALFLKNFKTEYCRQINSHNP